MLALTLILPLILHYTHEIDNIITSDITIIFNDFWRFRMVDNVVIFFGIIIKLLLLLKSLLKIRKFIFLM